MNIANYFFYKRKLISLRVKCVTNMMKAGEKESMVQGTHQ